MSIFVGIRQKLVAATVLALGAVCYFVKWPAHVTAQNAGLIAAYSFNEGTGSTVADLSGNNITGTIVGAAWTTQGRYGNALSFNGSSTYVDLGNPAALQLTGSMTVEAWVNAAASPPDDGDIVSKSTSSSGWQLKSSPDTGPHTFAVAVSGAANSLRQRYSALTRSLGTWYHVAGVYSASAGTLDIYVNGSLNNGALVGAIPFSQINQAVNVNIGRNTAGYYFNGTIDEVRIYNRALSAAEIQNDMMTPLGGTPPPPDTTPPTVSISAPASGASVTGTISVTANAADNVGVAGVQLLLDGASLGNELVGAPYSLQWNTGTTTLGSHTLSAIARDYAGNTATAANVPITVTNASAAQVGSWSQVYNWPTVSVHAVLLTTGNVLAWSDYTINQGVQLWRPVTNTFTNIPYNPVNLFCAGHAYMADGRVMNVGGTVANTDDVGPRETTFFDPATETWSAGPLMVTGRYYPTLTTLPDGRMLVQGGTVNCGTCIADFPEIYDPATNAWTQLSSSARMSFKYYPHPHVLTDGSVLVSSQDDKAISSKILNLTTQTWSTVDPAVRDGHSSVMYLPGKVLKAGTATADNPGLPAARTAYVLDTTQPSPVWQATGLMAFPRSFLNLTVLPDGQVLATGGGTTTDNADFTKAVFEAEIWSPTTQAWTTMSRMQTPRLYHSIALLLPDGRVLVSGGGRQNGRSQPDPKDQPNGEIFSPPYLFKGPRPVISSAPAQVQYGTTFFVSTPDAARIASASLIPPAAVTHAFNENQRFVPLGVQQAAGGVNLQAPANSNLAPPGPYMLFLVDNTGVPSTAVFVRLPAPGADIQPPTAPTGLAASTTIGAVNLLWNASTDNIGVTGYNIHRSTTSGFAPTAANKIGQTSATNYTDTAFTTGGSYFYLITATDARNNISSPSNEATATVILDTIAPSVSITSPAAGTTVSGLITLAASASDNVIVAGVQFRLDNTDIGAEVTGPGSTYILNWSSGTVANGPHTLSARARDGAGNATISPGINITVANAAPSGLVAAYNFDEGSGSTVSDSSGNNITGTIIGATWSTAGKYGKALSFNGTASYVDLGNPAALQLTGSLTLEAWVNATGTPGDDGEIISKSTSSSGWHLKTTPDTKQQTFGVAVPSNGGFTQRYSSTVRALNTWYHVAGVYDSTARTLSIYVNGVLNNGSSVGTIPASLINQAVNVNIGRRTGAASYYFIGLIDDVRIYNRALSAAEIQTDMATPVGGAAPPDTTPPSTPANLMASTSGNQINLAWTASTDNVGITAYLVERCQGVGCSSFTQIGTAPTPGYSDPGLAPGNYSYRVRASDATNNLSGYSNIAGNTVLDSQAPTAPGNLTAGTVSTSQIGLSWTAATDNVGVTQYLVERCQGAGCSNFAQIGTVVAPTLTYPDSGLSANTSYTYRVRATDAASNLGAYSSPATGTTAAAPDTQPPTAPSNLMAGSANASQITLNWTASSDNVGVTQYLIERCQNAGCTNFAQIATVPVPGVSYTDNGLLVSTSYTYQVRASDAALNLSPYSGTATATTTASGTGTPVFVSEVNSATDGSGVSFNTSTLTMNVTGPNALVIAAWHAEFDGGAPDSWSVTLDGVPGTKIVDTNGYTGGDGNRRFRIYYWLNPRQGALPLVVSLPYNGPNELAVSAILLNNVAQVSPLGSVVLDVSTADRTAESETANTSTSDLVVHVIADALVTRGVLGPAETSRSIANDGHHPADGDASLWISTKPGDVGATTVSSSGWAPRVLNGVAVVVHAAGSDTQPPTAPGSLTTGSVTTSQIALNWTASIDNVGVTQYFVERCQNAGCSNFAQVGSVAAPTTTYTDTNLLAGTSYTYRVRAGDAASNLSPYSGTATATTVSAPDTQAPTAPGSLTTGSVTTSQITLNWTASTDNVGVTQYFVERCQNVGCSNFAQFGIVTAPAATYTDNNLLAGTSYTYRVRATDAASNLSPYSGTATATTAAPDIQPPTAPGSLTLGAVTVNQAILNWTPSTDNIGVTQYLVERCQNTGCSNFAQVGTVAAPTLTYTDNGLSAATTYVYRVRATDAAANLSPYSQTVTATTSSDVSGLIAGYSFNQGAGTTAPDSSSNGITGTLSGATWTTAGKYGNALSFNGSNAYVNLANPNALKITGSMTWAAWVKATGTPPNDGDIISKSNGSTGWHLKTSPDTGPHTFAIAIPSGSGFTQRYSTTIRALNTWYHLAGVYNAATRTLDIYVNGVLDNGVLSGAVPTSMTVPNVNVNIGRRTVGYYFNGIIDDARIYNRALSASEIQAIMNTPLP